MFGMRYALVALLAGPCLALGQGLESSTATVGPSGEVVYESSVAFPLIPLEHPPIVGASYSAEEVAVDNLFSSGDQTPRPLRKLYRDSQGRIRVERPLPLGPRIKNPPSIVEIQDVVSGFTYVLDTDGKIAHRYRTPKPGEQPEPASDSRPGAAIAVEGQRAASPARPNSEKTITQPPKTATNSPIEPTPYDPLASREMEGVTVEGKRYTTVLGLTRVVKTEVWTSTDLQLVVLTKISDPEQGDRSVRLRNLSRQEPNPTLFEIPPGYKIQEERSTFYVHVKSVIPRPQ